MDQTLATILCHNHLFITATLILLIAMPYCRLNWQSTKGTLVTKPDDVAKQQDMVTEKVVNITLKQTLSIQGSRHEWTIMWSKYTLRLKWILLPTLPTRQSDCHFADDIFRCIFVNDKFCILMKISLKFIHKGPTDNNPALVQIMGWHRAGDKPLYASMMVSFATHICVSRPQWVKENIIDSRLQGWVDN